MTRILHFRAVPSTIIQRIQPGEFVNFDSLLPSNVGRASNSIISLKFDGESLSLSNNNDKSTTNILRTKNKVNDFHSWMLAWTLFYQIMVQHNSTLVHQLIKYQLFITNLASQYIFSAWYSYDQAFNQHMANNRFADWGAFNDFLFNLHVRGQPGRTKCYICSASDHFASRCPSKSRLGFASSTVALSKPAHPGPRPYPPHVSGGGSASGSPRPFRPPQRTAATSPFPASQRAQNASASGSICINFNNGWCNRVRCHRLHQCFQCQGNHSFTVCPLK